MGILDLTSIDARRKKQNFICSFGGNLDKFAKQKAFLDKNNIPYIVRESGQLRTITDANNKQTTYMDSLYTKEEMPEIFRCIQSLTKSVDEYEKENGKIESGKYITGYVNEGLLKEQLLEGNSQITLVDINHCYWRILYNSKIINDELYEKYLKSRAARLVAVGSMKKQTTIISKIRGIVRKELIDNPRLWVWEHVCFQSYLAVSSVKELAMNNIYAYNVDGIYLPEKYALTSCQHLEKMGLPAKIIVYEVHGKSKQYTVLRNLKTGKFKRANLGNPKFLNIQEVDFDELEKMEE